MQKSERTAALGQWVMTVCGVILLAVACLGSAFFLYGGTNQNAAVAEALGLENIEMGELIGSKSYLRDATPTEATLLSGIFNVLHIPFANPLTMLTDQLPQTDLLPANASTAEASLFGAITTWAQASHKVALGWAPDASAAVTESRITDNPGINVISPSWYTLKDSQGHVSNASQAAVVKYAHAHHVAVWALFDNQFNMRMTHAILSDSARRSKLVQTVVQDVVNDKLDGLNVDFENVGAADRDNFTRFIDELHAELAPKKIVLSVDITPDIVTLNDDAAFFHAGLAAVCDYVILMAYDEHWSSDQTPGPVADVPWVTQSVNDLLDTGVPTDKLILGLPFYTRFWHVHNDGSVTSESDASTAVAQILHTHKAVAHWDANLSEMYARYKKSDGYEEVWYETQATVTQKLNLVTQNGLAGVAVWSLPLSSQHAWSRLIEALQQSLS